MSIVTARAMVCDVCGWRINETEWEYSYSLPTAVDRSVWFDDRNEDVSLCPHHAAEELALRDRVRLVPSAEELADWTHPRSDR